MPLPERLCRQTAIGLLAIASFSGALAFRAAPATTRLRRGISPPNSFFAAASSGENGDWCIGEEEGGRTDGAPLAGEPASDAGDAEDDDTRSYFATCIPGLQGALASELTGLGASRVEAQGKSGVRFRGGPTVGLKSILWCRTAHKIMELIASSQEPPAVGGFDFDYDDDFSRGIINRDDLYRFTRSAVHTPSLLGDGSGGLLTLSVSTIYASRPPSKELCHGHFTALTVKNSLVDSVRDLREDGDRPDVDVVDADVPLVVVIRGRRVGGSAQRREWRDRKGRHRHSYDGRGRDDEEGEMVADVDLYRVLHSGGSLHRRGYRRDVDAGWADEDGGCREGKGDDWGPDDRNLSNSNAPIHRAAMKESMAAGLLLETGWDKLVLAARGDGEGAVLVDPMAGSGTFPTEAALIACDMAPGLSRIVSWRDDGSGRGRNPHRHPPCLRWKDFSNVDAWDELVAEAARRARSGMEWARSSSKHGKRNVRILCNEVNPRAVASARNSIRRAGVGSIVSLSQGDCRDFDLGGGDPRGDRGVLPGRTIFVCNPPWGLRLTENIDESWVSLREFLRREAGACEAWVLSGNKDLTRILRMKKSRTVVLRTADEDLRFLQYHVFQKREAPAMLSGSA